MRFLLLGFLLLPLAGCGGSDETIAGAETAYSQNRIGEAETILRAILARPGATKEDKAAARYGLGHITWLIDGDAARGLAELHAVTGAGPVRCKAVQLEARILREAHRPADLLARAGALTGGCAAAAEADSIRLDAAAAALDLASAQSLAVAARLIGQAEADSRTSLRGSAIRLRLALLTGDAGAALQAWKDYFWLSGSDVPQALANAYPAAVPVFDAGLAANASPAERLPLVDMLVRAGFAAEAESFANARRLPELAAGQPLWRKAKAYLEARRSLEAGLLESNRRVARAGSASDLPQLLDRFEVALMAGAGLSGERSPALRRAYGLYARQGDTDGYASLHIGHIVQLERRRIAQYGHRADVTFLAIDNMIANGFDSWLWDGAAAAGGWTEEGPVIVQVRPQYTSTPLSAWTLFSDGEARRQLIDRQPKRNAEDLASLRGEDVAFLAGLSDRLKLQVADQVGAAARRKVVDGTDLRRAFLAEYWRASFQQSIFLHEGRHALDRELVRGLARLRDSNLEYRAKLSELGLADYPRLALFNINANTIGGGSAHGKANAKLLGAYVEWMRGHEAEIRGYDRSLPPLAQIDRLSDAQMRAIARGLDPIAGKS